MKQKDSSHREKKKLEILINHYNLWFVLFEGVQLWASKYGQLKVIYVLELLKRIFLIWKLMRTKRSLVFPFYCFPLLLIAEEGLLISNCNSLEFCVQMVISFLFSFAFHFSSFSAICKASSDNNFAFLHFFLLGMVLITASCTMSRTSIRSSSGALSVLIPWIYLSLPLYNHKGFDLGHTWIA